MRRRVVGEGEAMEEEEEKIRHGMKKARAKGSSEELTKLREELMEARG